ncbi:putative DSBA-like thioredoxin domain, Thioredoxin-like superfamily [Dioscorea sansibarensis]
MANSALDTALKKLIQIDVISDTVCPWCFVGKKNIEKAMDLVKDQFDFEVRWHPYFLNPSAPKEGIKKTDHYKLKFGIEKSEAIASRMEKVFHGIGLEYDTSELTGNTMDSHRLIALAAHQGYDKQNALVEELFFNYFCEGKYVGDHQVLLDAAEKVGVEGAAEVLGDPSKLLQEINEELEKYPARDTGVPLFLINGEHKIFGGQPPEVFLKAFQAMAEDNTT